MAKDGISYGGPRIGAGKKAKPLADNLLDGNPGRHKLNGRAEYIFMVAIFALSAMLVIV